MDEEDKEMVMCSTAEWSAQDSGSDLGQGQDQAKPGGIKIWPRSSSPLIYSNPLHAQHRNLLETLIMIDSNSRHWEH